MHDDAVVAEPLERRSSHEQHRAGARTLLIPVGSFEQHGSHLPLATDTIIANCLCRDVSELRRVDVAPAVAYSASGEHEGFAGLLSIGTDVTERVLTELIRSARATWSGVIFLSGHGGNVDALERATSRARDEGDSVRYWMPRDPTGDAHAGASETSLMLTIDPSLVRFERLEGREAALPDDWFERIRAGGVRAVSTSGVLGNPLDAREAYGWALRRRWCAEVVAMIDELEENA